MSSGYTNAPRVEAFEPRTELLGWAISLANNAEQTFPGRATEDETYRNHAVPYGARRRSFICTIKPSVAGYITFRNKKTNALLGVLNATSGSSAIELVTACDIVIKNKSGGALSNAVDTDEISIAETFYLDFQ